MEQILLIKCPKCNNQIKEFKNNSYICENCGLVEPISLSPEEMLNVLPYDIMEQIVSQIPEQDIFEMIKLRKVNKEFREIVDRRINTIYKEKYGRVPEVVDVDVVLDILREYLPYRKGKTQFEYGDFGYPNDSLQEKYNKILNYYMSDEDLKEFRSNILTEILFEDNYQLPEIFSENFDGENFDKQFDELTEEQIEELNVNEDITKSNLYDILETIRYTRAEDFSEFYEFYPELVNELFESFYNTDNFVEIQRNYINKIVRDEDKYKIGDYFYYYNFDSDRQYTGIGMVDYDVMNGVKIPVFDGEGMPSLTPEIENQIRQLGTDITYPTDEIQNFLENFR